MTVQNLYHANLKISQDGTVSVESAWRYADSDCQYDVEALLDAARSWAGQIGDPGRVPEPDGSYHYSERLRVTGIDFRPLNAEVCEIIFRCGEFGSPETGGALVPVPVGTVTDVYLSDGTHNRSSRFQAPAGVDASLIPKPGQPLDWEGGVFVCESCTVTDAGIKQLSFEVTAREVTQGMLGNPSVSTDAEGNRSTIAHWFVGVEEFDDFLQKHPIGGAAAWAGEAYVLQAVVARPFGKVGYEMQLTARQVETRMISEQRSEELTGFNRNGIIRREIVWTSRWSVHATDLPEFFGLSGTTPVNWADEDCIVTKVTPRKLSDLEYEVLLEARNIYNPSLKNAYAVEDWSNLASRTDYSVDMIEFHVNPEMAGYYKSGDGRYTIVLNWVAQRSCPFETTDRLAQNLIDSTLRCLLITETIYKPGSIADHMAELSNWVSLRVSTAAVGTIQGSFLRVRQTCKEVVDDTGVMFTRINRSYQMAPSGLTWNIYYWANH